MASKIKVDQIQTADGTGTIALQNQLSGMTTASLPTITTDKLGAGAVLQVVTNMPNLGSHSLSTSSWTEVSSSFRQAITPIYSNSKLIIEVLFMFGGNNSSNLTHFKIHDQTNGADVELSTAGSRQGVHGTARQVDADLNDVDMMYIQTVTTSANTNARTYGFYAKNESGTTAKYYFTGASNSGALSHAKPIFKITEIKQ
jgi:hypothetical protein